MCPLKVFLFLFGIVIVHCESNTDSKVIVNKQWELPFKNQTRYYYKNGEKIDVFCWGDAMKYGSLSAANNSSVFKELKKIGESFPYRFTTKLRPEYNASKVTCDYKSNKKVEIQFIMEPSIDAAQKSERNALTAVKPLRDPDDYNDNAYQLNLGGFDEDKIIISAYYLVLRDQKEKKRDKKMTIKYFEFEENDKLHISCSSPAPTQFATYAIKLNSVNGGKKAPKSNHSIYEDITLTSESNGTEISCTKGLTTTTNNIELKVILLRRVDPVTTSTSTTTELNKFTTKAPGQPSYGGIFDSKIFIGVGVIGIIVATTAVVIICRNRKRKKEIQELSNSTYQNLENQPCASVTSIPHPPQWNVNNYANPRDYTDNNDVYAEPINTMPTYATPVPKCQRRKPNTARSRDEPTYTMPIPKGQRKEPMHEEPAYASVGNSTLIARNQYNQTDDPNYCEITNYANLTTGGGVNPSYNNVFDGSGYQNAGNNAEYVEPAYYEVKKSNK